MNLGGKSLWFACGKNLVKQTEGVLSVQLTRSRPAQLLTHVRYMIEFAAAGDNAQRKILDFLEPLHVIFRAVSVDRKTVTDVREDQGIDHDGQKFRGDLVAHVGQSDEDTVAFFDEGGYVGVPGEVLVEHNAKVPHRGALTHHILAEPDSDGSQVTTILTGAA